KFRPDLYYRLDVLAFHLPPLRERKQDLVTLVSQLITRFNARFQKELARIHPEVMIALESYPWPGNIRQLENVMQLAVLTSKGPELLPEHLPKPVREGAAGAVGTGRPAAVVSGPALLSECSPPY